MKVRGPPAIGEMSKKLSTTSRTNGHRTNTARKRAAGAIIARAKARSFIRPPTFALPFFSVRGRCPGGKDGDRGRRPSRTSADESVDLVLCIGEKRVVVGSGSDSLLEHRDQDRVYDLLPLLVRRPGRGGRRVERRDQRLEVLVAGLVLVLLQRR